MGASLVQLAKMGRRGSFCRSEPYFGSTRTATPILELSRVASKDW